MTLQGGQRLRPHVLELTFGVDRNVWALGDVHLTREGERTVWRLPSYLAPVTVGVFPLIEKAHAAYAQRLAGELAAHSLRVAYDDASSIGRRYARMDEAGTPFCVTVDATTVDEGPAHDTVTVRQRDSKQQDRVPVAEVAARLLPATRFPRPSPDGSG